MLIYNNNNNNNIRLLAYLMWELNFERFFLLQILIIVYKVYNRETRVICNIIYVQSHAITLCMRYRTPNFVRC